MRTLCSIVVISLLVPIPAVAETAFDAAAATRFVDLALACVHKEYPNKIAHALSSDADVKPPRLLTPAFYGCYDWHSSVHGHWLLARLARSFPDSISAEKARAALAKSLTTGNIAVEVSYLEAAERASFERPYGLAWLLQLAVELREWDDPRAKQFSAALLPLEKTAVRKLTTWLPKLSFPVRSGEHSQSAFALGLMLDYSRGSGEQEFAGLVERKIRDFYLRDLDCPIEYEPSGEDFVSPCIAEADAVRRILKPAEFAAWLGGFFPSLSRDTDSWLRPAVPTDRSDGKLAHLDGLNLSRAWMLEGIASALPPDDPRRRRLQLVATAHREAGLASVTGGNYAGGHWLGSFATYLVTQRGIAVDAAALPEPSARPRER